MYQKAVRYLGKSSIVVIVCLFLLKILIGMNSAHVLISNEFYDRIYIFLLVISSLIGFFIFMVILNTKSRPDAVVNGRPSTRTRPSTLLILIVVAGMVWVTCTDLLPSIVAFGFHHAAQKEEITINAEIRTVGRAHLGGTYLLKCTYWLVFSKPELSPFSQDVCIDRVQYDYFKQTNLPAEALLFGQESEYGYDLHCCK